MSDRPDPVAHRGATERQIEEWERLAVRMIASPAPEAAKLGLELRAMVNRERERFKRGDYVTVRHWWDWERAMRKAGLR